MIPPHRLSDVRQQGGGRGRRHGQHGRGQPHHPRPVLPPAEEADGPQLPQASHRGRTQDAAQILCKGHQQVSFLLTSLSRLNRA